MSHYMQIALQIKSIDCLGIALKSMGYTLIKGQISDFGGKTRNVDYAIKEIKRNGKPAVGFIKNNGEYDLVGDFYSTSANQHTFQKELKQKYSLELMKQEVVRQGYTIGAIKTNKKGQIEIQVETK